MICGLSLGSQRTMLLTRDIQEENMSYASNEEERELLRLVSQPSTQSSGHRGSKDQKRLLAEGERLFPSEIRMILPPRSLYIMKGITRYFYAHAVLGKQFNPPPPDREDAYLTATNNNSPQNSVVHEITDNSLFKRRISLIFRN
jgi:hypothetical protein